MAVKQLAIYDEATKCPKCGHDDVGTVYHPTHVASASCWCRLPPGMYAHLCRTCRRCGFGWQELPLDAVAPEPTAQGEVAR